MTQIRLIKKDRGSTLWETLFYIMEVQIKLSRLSLDRVRKNMKGWRANASYFYIAKAFVRDEVDIDILEEMLALGELGIQYCIKTERAYKMLTEHMEALQPVDFSQFNEKYNMRDTRARENMRKLIDSDRNRVTNVFSTLL